MLGKIKVILFKSFNIELNAGFRIKRRKSSEMNSENTSFASNPTKIVQEIKHHMVSTLFILTIEFF